VVSNLALEQFGFGFQKPRNFAGHQIFANLDFQSKRKRRLTLIGVGNAKYQTQMIWGTCFGSKMCFCAEALVKIQISKVVLN